MAEDEKKELEPISVEKAMQRFKSMPPKARARDLASTSDRVAPAVPKNQKDIELQHEWYKNPGKMDFEGVDTGDRLGYALPSGDRMSIGEYPRVVQWKQGNVQYKLDLKTGKSTKTGLKGQRNRNFKSPEKTLKVISTSTQPPRETDFRVGFNVLTIGKDGLHFGIDRTLTNQRSNQFHDNNFRTNNEIKPSW